MKNREDVIDWLKRAKSNLEKAKLGKSSKWILYEDLCFDAQQCVEKSLKALLISLNVIFPWTHSIDTLLQLVSKAGIEIPEELKESVILTRYAVETRYPGESSSVDIDDYKKAVELGEKVYKWVVKLTGKIKK